MEDLKFWIFILISGLIIFGVGAGTSYRVKYLQCAAQATALNYKYEYSYWAGCVVTSANGKKKLLKYLRNYAE